MKKTLSVTTALTGLSLLVAQMAFAAPPINQSNPEVTMKGFLAATKAGNVQLMQDYSKNVSFADDESEGNWMKEGLENDPLVRYEIVSKSKISDTRVDFMVKEVHKNQVEEYPVIPYTVVNENEKWTVLFQLHEVNQIKGSPDFGKVTLPRQKFQEQQKEANQETHPSAAIAAVYWNFSGLMPNNTIYGANKFNQVRNDGLFTLNGWQQASSGVADVLYSVISKTSNGYNTYIQKDYSGNYPQYGTWFGSYEYSLPYNSSAVYQMMFTNDGLYSVSGSGNGYE